MEKIEILVKNLSFDRSFRLEHPNFGQKSMFCQLSKFVSKIFVQSFVKNRFFCQLTFYQKSLSKVLPKIEILTKIGSLTKNQNFGRNFDNNLNFDKNPNFGQKSIFFVKNRIIIQENKTFF